MRPLKMMLNTQLKMFALLLFFIVSSAIDAFAQLQLNDSVNRRVEVIFNRKLVKKDLDEIQRKLFMRAIMLQYDHLDFDKKGRLVDIKFSVDCKDGFSGRAETTGLTKKSKFGFFRDYAADATATKPPFGTGDLSEMNDE
jgi:hypothetical protein